MSVDGSGAIESRSRRSSIQATAETRESRSFGCKLDRRTARIVVVQIITLAWASDLQKRETSSLLLCGRQLWYTKVIRSLKLT
jgi:hypothetical protein